LEVHDVHPKKNLRADCLSVLMLMPLAVTANREVSLRHRRLFATDVCRNCDVRFTCASYRAFAGGRSGLRGHHGRSDEDSRRFFGDYDPEKDVEDARDDNLAGTATPEELEESL
jgi:hypothetical protein